MRLVAERKSLFVPVLCEPALDRCWSVNISEAGIGLVARAGGSGGATPVEGQRLELDFPLPDGNRVRVEAEVRWLHSSDRPVVAGTISLGLRFERFEGDGQVRLRRFLAEHHLRVVVCGASETLERELERAFRGDLQLLFSSDPQEVERLLERGDIAAVLLCGADEAAAAGLARLIEQTAHVATTQFGRPPELKPRVVFAARAAPELLVDLFNGLVVNQTLRPDAPVGELRTAVLAACRAHEMQLEQQRMAIELERLLRDRLRPAQSGGTSVEGPGFVSAPMQAVITRVRQVAPYKVTVLLQGETGTGKEVLARRIHGLSPRSRSPFVVQDCGAMTETLLDSELFGHVKGAFTGAVADHPGLFALADGGTVFLDEIENTTANLQAKLLRVIETGEVRPVGGSVVKRVDVRVVAASNRKLSAEVRNGHFRADLYYRLNTFTLEVPPLRRRREDVMPLARSFTDSFNQLHGKSAQGFTPDAEQRLLAWHWPGNIRELRNAIERAVLLSAPLELIDTPCLPPELQGGQVAAEDASLRGQLAELERTLIGTALEKSGGVLRRAAVSLKIDAATLARRARKLGLLDASRQ